jgi:uncharacterized protein (TIGR02145 family)
MNIKIRNLLLIGSIVLSVILSSCSKDDDDNNSSGGGTTPPTNGETGTFTDSRDSKTYKWVKIGDQVWMAENLNYTGSDIQHITDDNEWANNSDYDGWCYYENNESYGNTYGALYQWEAAKKACLSGWHLPTDEEWTQLENYLKENGYSYDGVIGNKGIAKSLATNSGWSISDHQGAVGNSDFSEFRNKTGFSALPSGYRSYSDGTFGSLGDYGNWWSATEYNSGIAYGRYLCYYGAEVGRGGYGKSSGYSVRCVRD